MIEEQPAVAALAPVTGPLGVLLCGVAVAWLTGAYRLPTRGAVLTSLIFSVAGPFLLTAVMLAASW
jgi:hypothetical protein